MAGQLGQAKMGLYRDMHLEDIKQKALARGDLNAYRNADLAQKAAVYAQRLGVDKAKVAAKLGENWAKATKDFEESQYGMPTLVKEFERQFGKDWRADPKQVYAFNQQRMNAISERAGRMALGGVQQADDLE
jgi:hypothetical protein